MIADMLASQRLRIRFYASGTLPVTYREGLQAALYRLLPPGLGSALHDRGLVEGGKPLKLFVFSRLLGLRYEPEGRRFRAPGEVALYFATALPEVLSGLQEGLWARGGMEVEGVWMRLLGLEWEVLPLPDGALVVEALAPITVYRTQEGYTQYYNPWNREFAQLLEGNLNRKAQALGLEAGRLEVRPLGVRPGHRRVESYKGTWVEGWMGRYRLLGSPQLLRLALLTGLGAKNSQGFGFVREVRG